MELKLWGIGMMILGSGAIMAGIANWDWWFRINSPQAQVVHDVFGRLFARLLNVVAGFALLIVGTADVSDYWPVSAFLNAWIIDDQVQLQEVLKAETHKHETIPAAAANSGLSTYSPATDP